MIRILICIYRRPDQTPYEFRDWVAGPLSAAFQTWAEAAGALNARLTLAHAIPDTMRIQTERGTAQPFDALAEAWWPRDSPILLQEPALAVQIQSLNLQGLLEELADYPRTVVTLLES